MIRLKKEPVAVAAIWVAPVGAVAAGSVYVGDANGATELPAGKRAVLLTDGGRRELLTSSTAAGIESAGTYLNQSDWEQLTPALTNPKLRLYRLKDFWAKVFSLQGLLLALSAIIGLVAAGLAIYLAVWGAKPTSAGAVADRATIAFAWVVEPADQLDSNASPEEVNAARGKIDRRAAAATQCLAQLSGREAQKTTLPGVMCEPKSPKWYRDKDTAAWIALAVGLLTALFAILRLHGQYGFQKSPSGG